MNIDEMEYKQLEFTYPISKVFKVAVTRPWIAVQL